MKNIDQLAINTIRIISAEAVEKAKSGHPGLPMGAAPMAFTLWSKHLKHNPKNSMWIDRDRFVLSAGHGSMLLYSLLHIFGYDISMDDIKEFRQFGSKTPGHPEYMHTDGVETTTGPLGQGICNAVGMAMAEAYLAEKFNKDDAKVIDHYTYTLAGDGCLMEGISSEACSLAGTLALGKLIMLYDSNRISIEGSTELAFREDVAKRFEAYGWQVLKVSDGNDVDKISEAIVAAKAETKKPSILIISTEIGYGSPNKQGKASAHGEPLGVAELQACKENLESCEEEFTVPLEVLAYADELIAKGQNMENEWLENFERYQIKYPKLAAELDTWYKGDFENEIKSNEEFWRFEKPLATREASGILINRLSTIMPNLMGGSADLAPSNKTHMAIHSDFSAENRAGANIHFGVREHAMAAIGNGLKLHGGLKIFVSTFFVFTDYMKGAMRLSALMKLPVTYVLTHDSIGVGEDGPTHEPIEHLAALRSIPNMTVFRPADANETAVGWYLAATKEDGPVSLVLTRQTLPLYAETGMDALKGAYTISESENKVPDLILIASGSEVELVKKAGEILRQDGLQVRVVSMPSFELFEKQSPEYKESILPKAVRKRVAVEAGSSFGWHKYVGLDGEIVSIDHYGASGKPSVLFEKFGFTVDNVLEKARKIL